MPNNLSVPHYKQLTAAGCLSACAQMVLAYLGVMHTQAELARILDAHPEIGVPYENITRLHEIGCAVHLAEAKDLDELAEWLVQQLPIIAFVEARELPHWRKHPSQHAIVIVGIDDLGAHILDPAADDTVLVVPIDDFILAWIEMDKAYAVITVN
jgi:ABC-type bacteriocin/lantibiotic exporter with double-glycine peptidase domain